MERKLIAAAVSSALALPMAAQAVEFSVSGHVNRAIISVDDGDKNDGDLQHVDANSSQTRFRFTGSEELDSGMTAGVQLEIGGPANWRTRHANVYLSTAGGRLTLGQGGAAADNMAHARLGGQSWLGGVTNWCSYHSARADGSEDADGSKAAVACQSNDGSRSNVLKYDTPAIGPASIAVSTGNNDFWDAQISIAGSFGDAGYDLRLGYIAETDGTATKDTVVHDFDEEGNIEHTVKPGKPARDQGDILTASAAFAFGQGTSVAVAWSEDSNNKVMDEDFDHEYQYVELDHSYGDGSIGIYYKRAEKGAVDGSLWGVGIGHDLGGGATAYAGYRRVSEDLQEDIDLVVAGMRVTFN